MFRRRFHPPILHAHFAQRIHDRGRIAQHPRELICARAAETLGDIDLDLKHTFGRWMIQHPIDDTIDAGIGRAHTEISEKDELVQQMTRVVVAGQRRAGPVTQFADQGLHLRMIEHGLPRGLHIFAAFRFAAADPGGCGTAPRAPLSNQSRGTFMRIGS